MNVSAVQINSANCGHHALVLRVLVTGIPSAALVVLVDIGERLPRHVRSVGRNGPVALAVVESFQGIDDIEVACLSVVVVRVEVGER